MQDDMVKPLAFQRMVMTAGELRGIHCADLDVVVRTRRSHWESVWLSIHSGPHWTTVTVCHFVSLQST